MDNKRLARYGRLSVVGGLSLIAFGGFYPTITDAIRGTEPKAKEYFERRDDFEKSESLLGESPDLERNIQRATDAYKKYILLKTNPAIQDYVVNQERHFIFAASLIGLGTLGVMAGSSMMGRSSVQQNQLQPPPPPLPRVIIPKVIIAEDDANDLDLGAKQYKRMKGSDGLGGPLRVLEHLAGKYPSLGMELSVTDCDIDLQKLKSFEGSDAIVDSAKTDGNLIEIRPRPSNYIVLKLLVDELISQKFLPTDRVVPYHTSIGYNLGSESIPILIASILSDTPIDMKLKEQWTGGMDLEFPGIYLGQTVHRYTGLISDNAQQTNIYDKVLLIPSEEGNWLIYPEDIRRKGILSAAAADFLAGKPLADKWAEYKENLLNILELVGVSRATRLGAVGGRYVDSFFPIQKQYIKSIVEEVSGKIDEARSLPKIREFIDWTVDGIEDLMFKTDLEKKIIGSAYEGNLKFSTILDEHQKEFPGDADEVKKFRYILNQAGARTS